MRKTIEKYFQAWIDVDLDTVKKVFSDDVIYTECYGPEYHGLLIGIRKAESLSGR